MYNSTRELQREIFNFKAFVQDEVSCVLISEGVVLCTGFNGVELGPEDVSLLEMCPLLGPN